MMNDRKHLVSVEVEKHHRCHQGQLEFRAWPMVAFAGISGLFLR
jgi:hypothetical protein